MLTLSSNRFTFDASEPKNEYKRVDDYVGYNFISCSGGKKRKEKTPYSRAVTEHKVNDSEQRRAYVPPHSDDQTEAVLSTVPSPVRSGGLEASSTERPCTGEVH